MTKPAPESPPAAPTSRGFIGRWWAKLLLLAASVLLLTLSYAPIKQFYFAWFGLVPWLLVVRAARGPWRAAFWSWIVGTGFFSANMWWLWFVTGPGVVALMAWMGLYFAGAGAVLWPMLRRLRPANVQPLDARSSIAFLFLMPVVIVAFEWLHGVWPFSGLSWLYLAHAQTPFLTICQIADITGELGVSFWVAMLNGLVLLRIVNGWRVRGLLAPTIAVAAVSALLLIYGFWRFGQESQVLSPGPVVMVVQPNIPQSNTGEKGASMDAILDFHVLQTEKALQAARTNGERIDLVVWSETMMPYLNPEARAIWPRLRTEMQSRIIRHADWQASTRPSERASIQRSLEIALSNSEDFLLVNGAHDQISRIARKYDVDLLVGSSYTRSLSLGEEGFVDSGRRNAAFHYQRGTGEQVGRFDKIHLVPFGEYFPFKESWPWFYNWIRRLGPTDMDSYQLDRGDRPVVFTLPASVTRPSTAPSTSPATQRATPAKTWRFVTPICFEDIDGDLNAWMFRGGVCRGGVQNGKQADLIVNITNDGWFRGTERDQHLQCATFRCIENRAPMARSVNTGISGFIDSYGRTDDKLLLPAYTPRAETSDPATLTYQVMLDSRTTFYTRWGNLIGPGCGIAVGGMLLVRVGRRFIKKRAA
jgi:apolipoprotein N-acyltransferase